MVLALVLGTFQFVHISKRDGERVTRSRRKNNRVIISQVQMYQKERDQIRQMPLTDPIR